MLLHHQCVLSSVDHYLIKHNVSNQKNDYCGQQYKLDNTWSATRWLILCWDCTLYWNLDSSLFYVHGALISFNACMWFYSCIYYVHEVKAKRLQNMNSSDICIIFLIITKIASSLISTESGIHLLSDPLCHHHLQHHWQQELIVITDPDIRWWVLSDCGW